MDSNQEPSTVFTAPVPKREPKLPLEVIILNLLAGMILAYWIVRLSG